MEEIAEVVPGVLLLSRVVLQPDAGIEAVVPARADGGRWQAVRVLPHETG